MIICHFLQIKLWTLYFRGAHIISWRRHLFINNHKLHFILLWFSSVYCYGFKESLVVKQRISSGFEIKWSLSSMPIRYSLCQVLRQITQWSVKGRELHPWYFFKVLFKTDYSCSPQREKQSPIILWDKRLASMHYLHRKPHKLHAVWVFLQRVLE